MNKAFEKILDRLTDAGGCDADCEYDKGWDSAIDEAISIVQEVAEEYNGGWIPCSERLPELDGTYICTCEGIAESITLIFSTHDNSWNDEFEAEYDDVIAWKQLPEPYKESD